jgi:hypothetical protein
MYRKVIKLSSLHYPSEKSVPFLRLRGHYLREAGFDEGDEVLIEIRSGEILIRQFINPFMNPMMSSTICSEIQFASFNLRF